MTKPRWKKNRKPVRTKDLPKTSQKIVKGLKVVKAAVGLASTLLNPINHYRMAKNKLQGKGYLYPGTHYLGPGNPLNNGPPTSDADRIAQQHDYDYDRLIKAGHSKRRVYGGFSDADQRAMDKSDVTTSQGLALYAGMGAKKILSKITGSKTIKDPPSS
jgi:hypothetical protein